MLAQSLALALFLAPFDDCRSFDLPIPVIDWSPSPCSDEPIVVEFNALFETALQSAYHAANTLLCTECYIPAPVPFWDMQCVFGIWNQIQTIEYHYWNYWCQITSTFSIPSPDTEESCPCWYLRLR